MTKMAANNQIIGFIFGDRFGQKKGNCGGWKGTKTKVGCCLCGKEIVEKDNFGTGFLLAKNDGVIAMEQKGMEWSNIECRNWPENCGHREEMEFIDGSEHQFNRANNDDGPIGGNDQKQLANIVLIKVVKIGYGSIWNRWNLKI
jgi:hypothetical protein